MMTMWLRSQILNTGRQNKSADPVTNRTGVSKGLPHGYLRNLAPYLAGSNQEFTLSVGKYALKRKKTARNSPKLSNSSSQT